MRAQIHFFALVTCIGTATAPQYNSALASPMSKPSPEKKTQSAKRSQYQGFYLTASGGGSWLSNQTGSTPVTSFAGVGYKIDTNQSIDGGFALEAGAGYDFGKFRAELTYARNSQTINSSQAILVQRTVSAPLTTNTINAYTNSNSLFATAYYDVATKSKLTPYIGAGIGVTQINWGGISASGFAYNLYQSPGAATAFGYQGKLGASYELNKSMDAFVEGTYQGASSFSVGKFTSGSPNQSGVNYNPMNLFGVRAGVRIKL